MTYFAQQVFNALSLGGTYALLALGVAVVFSIMDLINWAHGELITIGGYILLFVTLPFPVAVLAAVAGTAAAGVAMERIALRPVRNASPVTLLLTSFALSTLIRLVLQIFVSPLTKNVELPSFFSDTVSIGS